MPETLRTHRDGDRDNGFTLIELLVVVVIIGVLVAIAIPVYLNYRKGAENKSAESDIRGAMSAIEQYYTENGNVYPDAAHGTGPTTLSLTAQTNGQAETITLSSGNTLYIGQTTSTGGGAAYYICGENADGGTVYFYNSGTSSAVGKSTKTTVTDCDSNKGV
jgi:type IV pilus assembly protein PilA